MALPVRTPSAQDAHAPQPEHSVQPLNIANTPSNPQETNLKEQVEGPEVTTKHKMNDPSSLLSSPPFSPPDSVPNTITENLPVGSNAEPGSDTRKDSKISTIPDESELEPAFKPSDLAKMPGTGTKRSRKEDVDADMEPTPAKKTAKKTASKRASAKKKDPLPPPTPSNRPTRNRKAPSRLVEEQQESLKLNATPKAPAGKVFDPTYITTNSNSRLGKADIYHLLLESSAWDDLTSTDQAELISMLPPTDANISLLGQTQDGIKVARPKELSACEIFRTDVAKFQEDLRNGHLAKGWQNQAKKAMVDRKDGLFDEWKRMETEAWWGQKMR